MSDTLLWIDVETSGLEPRHDILLEIAMLPTSFDREFMQLVPGFEAVFYHGRNLTLQNVSPEVLKMHADSGLWQESRDSAEERLVWPGIASWIDEWRPEYEAVYPAGRSVHFDCLWLEARMPGDLWRRLDLSHRHFDLSSIKAFLDICGCEFSVPQEKHRAMQDIYDDIGLVRKLAAQFSV